MSGKTVHSLYPILAVIIPFVFAILIALVGERAPRVRNGLVLVGAVCTFAVVANMVKPVISQGMALESRLPFNLGFIFRTLPLGLMVSLLASFMWMPTMVYAFGYMAHEHAQTRFYTVLTIALSATMAILNAGNIFTLFVFYEVFSLSVYTLVIHEETPEAMAGGRVYLVYSLGGEALLLLGVLLVYGITGFSPATAAFAKGGMLADFGVSRNLLYLIAVLFMMGFGVKAAIMPLHSWLPQAMVAPTPVSAVLHAVAVVKVGVFAVITLLYLILGRSVSHMLGIQNVLPWFASATIITASLIAMAQDDIKRRLAYSTVSQLSYIILGASVLNFFTLRGALLHLLFHSFMKIVLFFCAGIIITQSGKKKFSQIAGQARSMPITWACFTIGAAGLVGIPPICGWVSKWTLVRGFLEAQKPWFVVVIVVSSFLNAAYWFPPVFSAWFGGKEAQHKESETKERKPEAPLSMLVPVSILAIAAILFGIISGFPYWLADSVAKAIF